MINKTWETKYTDEVVCPHCGYEHDCSYELFSRNDECSGGIECGDCGEKFDACRIVDVTYITKKTTQKSFYY